MIAHVLWFMLLMSLAGSAAMKLTITELKITSNYKTYTQDLYYHEGLAEWVMVLFEKGGTDFNEDNKDDKKQVHGNDEVIFFITDNVEAVIKRDPQDPNQAIIQVGRIKLLVNNFPGGGQSCANNNKCKPDIIAWREL